MTKLYLLELLDTGLYEAGYEVHTLGVFLDRDKADEAKHKFWYLTETNTRFPGHDYRSSNNLKVRVREVEEGRIIYFDKDPDIDTFGT